MSSPPNQLASFRSYSYYHVLVMCDSTYTADLLASSTYEDIWQHATSETAAISTDPNTESLGRYSPKNAYEPGNPTPVGRYVVLINGSTDAAYVIRRATWTSTTTGDAVPGDMSTSLAIEGSISISEPKGIAFLDQVVKCSVALGVDSSQVVWCLKTFFVGHGFDGSADNNETHEQITDIPPLNFICWDVTGSFTQNGGEYEMQFVAAGHGAARLPQYAKAVNGMHITAGTTLAETFTNLQNNINTNYSKYFKCVADQIGAAGTPEAQAMVKALRGVTYIIDVCDEYKDPRYTVTDQPEQYKNQATCDAPAVITFPASTSIEGAIRQIMSMSNPVQQDAARGDTKAKYEYKIHTAVRSVPQGGDQNQLEYQVIYRVERFMSPKSIAADSQFAFLQKDQTDEQLKNDPFYNTLRRNIIEFDYMYTGKNIDVLDFDMKVNMGLAYLQTATLSNTFKNQLERSPNRVTSASTGDVNNMYTRGGDRLMQIPVFFGSSIKTPGAFNAQDGATSLQSMYTMAKHASLEMAEAKMRIVGNTMLLGSTNRTSSPEQMIRDLASPKDAAFETANTPNNVANFHDWSRVPAFAKVNIKMPRNNDDMSLFRGAVDADTDINQVGFADYARDFWYDGYFYVCGIEHLFEDGEFSQTLDMISLPKNSAYTSAKGSKELTGRKEMELSTNVTSCFDNTVGCAGAGTTQPAATALDTIPVTPPSGTTDTTTRPDANVILNGKYSLSDVTGWTNASPDVQRAIVQAAQQVGVDPIVLAMFAAQESNFKPNANPGGKSSATGLFQFLSATWNGMVKAGKAGTGTLVRVGSPLAPSPGDPRFDPYNNAIAGANFLKDNGRAIGSNDPGDLYLAHFMGPSAAGKIIRADKSSSGSATVASAIGADAFAKVVSANSPYIYHGMTTGNIRTWAANTMARKLQGNVTKKAKNTKKVDTAYPEPAAVRAAQNQKITTSSATLPISTPRAAEQADVRKAENALAAQNNCDAQAAKMQTAPPCGPRPDTGATFNNSTTTAGDIRKLDDAAQAKSSSTTPVVSTGGGAALVSPRA